MRNRVLLHKLKFDSRGDFDRSAQNSKTVTIAHLDMTGAVDNQDYYIKQTASSTFRGQSVKVMRILIHHDWLTAHSTDWQNATNLAPKWGIKLNTQSNRYEFNEFTDHYHTVPLGVKPDDWDYRWYDKYYTKVNDNFYFDNTNSLPVTYPRGIQNTTDDTTPYTAWDATTQYYTADDGYETNVIWVTDRLLSLGGWSTFETWGTPNYPTYLYGFANGFRGVGQRFSIDRSYYRYKGGRSGFAVLDTDIRRLTSYVDNLIPGTTSISPNSYTRNSDVFLSKRQTLINDGHWEQNLFMFLVAFEMDGVKYVGVMMGYQLDNDPTTPRYPCIYAIEDLDDETLSPWGVEPPPSSGYTGPTLGPSGGNGSYTDSTSRTEVTGPPASHGFCYMSSRRTYKTDTTSVNQFLTDLQSGVDIDVFGKRIDGGIIDLYALPLEVTDVTLTSENFRAMGFVDTFGAPAVIEDYTFADMGYAVGDRFYNTFSDFAPFQSVSIHLPFIGDFELPPNEIVGNTVYLKYCQDNMTGDLVATVEVSPSLTPDPEKDYYHIIAQFAGNGKKSAPVTSTTRNLSGIASGIAALGQAALGVGMIASGNVVSGALSLAGAGVSAAKAMQEPAVNGQVHGTLSGGVGWMSYSAPYLRYTRSIMYQPPTYAHDLGYTTLTSMRLGDCSGFVSVRNADINTIPRATDAEKAEILQMLTSGIYV